MNKPNLPFLIAVACIFVILFALRAEDEPVVNEAPNVVRHVVIMQLDTNGNYNPVETIPVLDMSRIMFSTNIGAKIAIIEEVGQ